MPAPGPISATLEMLYEDKLADRLHAKNPEVFERLLAWVALWMNVADG